MAKKATNDKIDITTGYWHNWISAAKKAASSHWEISARAYNEYLLAESVAKSTSDTVSNPPARFPLFWSSIKNLQPAYYSRTPETVAKRMFDSADHEARVGCIILERLSKYLMSQYPIDDAMIAGTYDFLIADKATARVFFEEESEEITEVIPVIITQLGEYINANTGEILASDALINQNPDGSLFSEVTSIKITKVCTEVLPVAFNDILHTPNAQSWSEVKAIGFRLFLSKQEFSDMFTSKALLNVTFGQKDNDADSGKVTTGSDDQSSKITEGIEVWEIWDKPTKKVMYLCKGAIEFLKIIDDPYGLRDFFPCAPFIIGTKPPKSLYPTPMFKQLEPMIDQLHRLFTRITKMTSSLRRRGIMDSSMETVIEAINNLDDFEVMGSSHFAQLVESKAKGADPIWYLPLQELAVALREAQELLMNYKQLFFEISGVPDVVRGVTDYRETAQAQQQKGEFYNVRSSWDQHLIQEMARKLIEMQCDLALARMSDEMIIKVCHLESLEPEDLPIVPKALQLLKNDEQRAIRIDIETDSLTFVQNAKKQEEKNLIVQTVMQGLAQVAQIGQQSPSFLKPAMEMLMMSLRNVDLGKAYEQSVEASIKSLEEAANQPAQTPPDYEGLKLQIQQTKLGIENGKLELEKLKTNHDAMTEQAKEAANIEIEKYKLGQKDRELQLKADDQARRQELEAIQIGLKKQLDEVYAKLDKQSVEIEQYRVLMSEREKMIEEKRLDEKKITDQILLLEKRQQEPTSGTPQQPMIFNVNTASSKKITMQRDPASGALIGVSEVIANDG